MAPDKFRPRAARSPSSIQSRFLMDVGMSSDPNGAPTSVQAPLAGTEESAVGARLDGMDQGSEITDLPEDRDSPPSLREHQEGLTVETSLVGPGETEPAQQASTPEEVSGDRGSSSSAAGSDESQIWEEPTEGGEQPGDQLPHTQPVEMDVEEIGSESLQDEVTGLRKRQLPETPAGKPAPRVPVAVTDEDDSGGITLNKCLLVALLLVGVGFGIFDPEGEEPEAGPLYKREVDGHLPGDLEFPTSDQAWIADTAEGAPSAMISLSALLEKLASENQQIRKMHVDLQGQRDELEGLLRASGERLPVESQQSLRQLAQRLTEHLSHEEGALSALQGELRGLRERLDAAQGARARPGEGQPADGRSVERLLAQRENLAAEALMLRQELDKQRGIVASMRQALESLIERVSALGVALETPAILEGLEEMEQRLAFELERSEIWEKVYGTPREKRKKAKEAEPGAGDWQEAEGQTGRPNEPSPNATEPRGEEAVDADAPVSDAPVSDATREQGPGAPLAAPAEPTAQGDPPAGGGQGRAAGDRAWRESAGKAWEGGGGEGGERRDWPRGQKGHPRKPEGGKRAEEDVKAKEHKRRKETEKHRKRDEGKRRDSQGEHRHHQHNKFWKKDKLLMRPKHRYGVPVGCADVGSCARQEGVDLFDVALEPVRAEQFLGLLNDYIRSSGLGGSWGDELRQLVGPFFEDGVFVHQRMRFGDFLDDLDDYIEEIAEKVFGDDDAVEDFEDYVFRGLLGDAARKRRSTKKDKRKNVERERKDQEGSRAARDSNHHRHKEWDSQWRPMKSRAEDKGKTQLET
ncbi:pre-B-cell leukemia transcription factor-interacting protein 1-like isoform X2 [Carcharodon carcharias]|uniref:pre-B-cell leukemia transcription factor-interacting protein 1-like isoform X2 n=1 Tax=Carcharodon carcharias TaxID=13397 RepID=UPI001B7ED996|nr:pre-B-cell leukemia transcription factor-interacting protein 1-like isoform X2 [Carcharodon carcharias]